MEPTYEELTPVMRAYGNAVFTCTLLESGLKLLIGVVNDEHIREGLPPITSTDEKGAPKMLGQLFPEALKIEQFTVEQRKQIWFAIRLRNLLIHNYWTQKTLQAFLTPDGRAWLVEDLEHKREQVRDADRVITSFVDSYLSKHGVSVESLSLPLFAEYESNPGPPEKVLH